MDNKIIFNTNKEIDRCLNIPFGVPKEVGA